jgi:hypothetical protein
MSIANYKRLTAWLTVVIIVLLGLVWHFDMKFRIERLAERDLWFAIRDFDRMRDMALRSGPKDAVGVLDAFATIAPRSGTSPVEEIFEHERVAAVHDIIAYLRAKTGEDLGDDPKKWIDKFEKQSSE